MEEIKFKVITFASNKDGTKIFSRLTANKKTLIKGYYDFNKEKFYIVSYAMENLAQCKIGKNKAKNILKKILLEDYDWEI